jgi:pimeloyl-ACP methyl ester carboxylesterase
MSSAIRLKARIPYAVVRKSILASNAMPARPGAWRAADGDYGKSAEPDWRSIGWAAHLRWEEIDGRRVNCLDIGQGDQTPVLFIHGLSGVWQNFLENIPFVAQSRRVIAFDLPGFGESELPREQISIPLYAGVARELCERMELESVNVVGNSMGGFIGAELAIQQPELVDRLVLVSAAGISSANVYRAPTLLIGRVGAAMMANQAVDNRHIALRPRARQLALGLVARHPRLIAPDLAYEGLLRGANKPGFYPALRASVEYDFRERLPDISCPTLIVWGEDDSILSVRDADEYERLIPNTKKLVMRDTGHVPQVERPQVFNRELLEFLDAKAGSELDQEAA